jgi:hypothetical protein
MAPQAGFEPATDRLTADSSTTELLRNNKDSTYSLHNLCPRLRKQIQEAARRVQLAVKS